MAPGEKLSAPKKQDVRPFGDGPQSPRPADAFSEERPIRSQPPILVHNRTPYYYGLSLLSALVSLVVLTALTHLFPERERALVIVAGVLLTASTVFAIQNRPYFFAWPKIALVVATFFAMRFENAQLVIVVTALFGATLVGTFANKRELLIFCLAYVPGVFLAAFAAKAGLGIALAAAFFTLGFALLSRTLLFAAVRTVFLHEQARTDSELLKLYDDARMFRVVGRQSDDETGSVLRPVAAATFAVRDALYRLLRLGSQTLAADHAFVYLLDPAGENLHLKEQFSKEGHHEPQDGEKTLALKSTPLALALRRSEVVRLNRTQKSDLSNHHSGPKGALLIAPIRAQTPGQPPLGVVVFERVARAPFHEADEGIALGISDEIAHASLTERAMRSLDEERREKARVFTAARAFGGVIKRDEAVSVCLKSATEVTALDAALFVEIKREGASEHLVPRQSIGKNAGIFDDTLGQAFDLDPETWTGRAIAQGTMLPHIPLAQIPQSRGMLCQKDRRVRHFGDLRVIPLFAQGERVGALIVATEKDSRFTRTALDSLGVIADLAAVSFSGTGAYEKLEKQARTDPLTGLFNRRTLDAALNDAAQRSQRKDSPVSVILSDIDHFKSVNDTYGHQVGDDVLVEVAKSFTRCARNTDVVARYGGEEFCVVLEDTNREGAQLLAERMREEIAKLRFETDAGPFSVTSSFGVATHPEHDLNVLVQNADNALYHAKENGRNRVECARTSARTQPSGIAEIR